MTGAGKRGTEPVDLDDVQRLVDALERDLAKVRAGTAGVDSLREEVEALRGALRAAQPREEHVRERLHGVRSTLEDVGETLYEDAVKLGDYLARIGRMLGL
jgi:hypothetical protein